MMAGWTVTDEEKREQERTQQWLEEEEAAAKMLAKDQNDFISSTGSGLLFLVIAVSLAVIWLYEKYVRSPLQAFIGFTNDVKTYIQSLVDSVANLLDVMFSPFMPLAGPPVEYVGGQIGRVSAPILDYFMLVSLVPIVSIFLVAACQSNVLSVSESNTTEAPAVFKLGLARILGICVGSAFFGVIYGLMAKAGFLLTGMKHLFVASLILGIVGGILLAIYRGVVQACKHLFRVKRPEEAAERESSTTSPTSISPTTFRDGFGEAVFSTGYASFIVIFHMSSFQGIPILESLTKVCTLVFVCSTTLIATKWTINAVLRSKEPPVALQSILQCLTCIVGIWWVVEFFKNY